MTTDRLMSRSKNALLALARKQGIIGCADMTKEQLVKAIVRKRKPIAKSAKKPGTHSRRSASKAKPPTLRRKAEAKPRLHHPKQTSAARKSDEDNGLAEQIVTRSKFDVGVATKDLSKKLPRALPSGYGKDRIITMVRDPFWLHCYWEITRQSIARAEAALGQEWHTSRPILRVLDVSSEDTTSASETPVRDIDIHGGCCNWYIDVKNPQRSYRIDVGYLTRSGRFYVIARSNVVTTPRAGVSDTIDENWTDVAQNYEKIYAMSGGFDPGTSSLELKKLFEERLRRPMGSAMVTSFGSGAFGGARRRQFWFQLDAELIVYGATEPNAKVTLQGEPVQLRPDGTFTMRFSLPDSRQIIPATATSHDGVEERTIVLAVERNTKALEPLLHDGSSEQPPL
jgi:hypothetical protein